MKKALAVTLGLALIISLWMSAAYAVERPHAARFIDGNNDGVCDVCGSLDADADGVCDDCPSDGVPARDGRGCGNGRGCCRGRCRGNGRGRG